MEALLGGSIFHRSIDGWQVSWESRGDYRHWCIQEKPSHSSRLLVVMKNPGSLRGDGADLTRDTTLRILRNVGDKLALNQLVVNFFDYAATKLQTLHDNRASAIVIGQGWFIRSLIQCRSVLFAYGNFDVDHYSDYSARISLIRRTFKSLPEIRGIPTTKAGKILCIRSIGSGRSWYLKLLRPLELTAARRSLRLLEFVCRSTSSTT